MTPEEHESPARLAADGHGDAPDKYDRMLGLAELFEATADDLRARARLAEEVLRDASVAESAELSRATYDRAEADLRGATSGPEGLLARAIELDAEAVMVRATVQSYRWMDELQAAASTAFGSIAGRAIGYLAPEVDLGGAVVAAGLIETHPLDRDDVTTYLDELAAHNPELMDHVTSGGGGLLDGLHMRSLLTAGALVRDPGRLAAAGGLRAIGAEALPVDVGAALRDVAGGYAEPPPEAAPVEPVSSRPPRTLEELMRGLADSPSSVHVQRVGDERYLAYLPGPSGGSSRRLRLVGGDHSTYVRQALRAIRTVVEGDADPQVLLVGCGQGGVAAAEVAARSEDEPYTVAEVVTASAPTAQVTRLPAGTRILSLEDRRDPVALLGSLINAGEPHRLTVVFDGSGTSGEPAYVAVARAADAAPHPELVTELERLRAAGFLG